MPQDTPVDNIVHEQEPTRIKSGQGGLVPCRNQAHGCPKSFGGQGSEAEHIKQNRCHYAPVKTTFTSNSHLQHHLRDFVGSIRVFGQYKDCELDFYQVSRGKKKGRRHHTLQVCKIWMQEESFTQ